MIVGPVLLQLLRCLCPDRVAASKCTCHSLVHHCHQMNPKLVPQLVDQPWMDAAAGPAHRAPGLAAPESPSPASTGPSVAAAGPSCSSELGHSSAVRQNCLLLRHCPHCWSPALLLNRFHWRKLCAEPLLDDWAAAAENRIVAVALVPLLSLASDVVMALTTESGCRCR